MHFTIIDETVLPLSSFFQILAETSDKNDFKKKCSEIHSMMGRRQKYYSIEWKTVPGI